MILETWDLCDSAGLYTAYTTVFFGGEDSYSLA